MQGGGGQGEGYQKGPENMAFALLPDTLFKMVVSICLSTFKRKKHCLL